MTSLVDPHVSVVVLNYNGAHLLPECLQSLLAQDYPNLEILVVDNASVDESQDVVRRYPNVRWIALPTNGGLGPGYNTGAKQAQGELLFFLNNDTRCDPGCVSQLVKAFKNGAILAVDPVQTDWEGGRVIHGAQRFRWGWRYLLREVIFMEPYQEFDPLVETEIPWAGAGAFLCDRWKFEALGGFDPTFFLDYEDLDFCWRGWLRGWKTIFVPSAKVYHKVGESGHLPGVNERRRLSQLKNAQRFILKTFPWPVAAAVLLIGVAKAAAALLTGRPAMTFLRLKATLLNIKELPEILSERRRIRRQSVTNSTVLWKRWGHSAG